MSAIKRSRLTDTFAKIPETEAVEVTPILDAPSRGGWRHRARMVFGDKRKPGEPLLGFYEAGSRDVLEIERCIAHHPDIERVLASFRGNIAKHPALIEHLRFIDARRGERDGASARREAVVVLTLCMNHRLEFQEAWEREALALAKSIQADLDSDAGADDIGKVCLGLHLDVGTHGPAILSGDFIEVFQETTSPQEVGDVVIDVPPKAFFQVNPPQLARTHALMRAWLEDLSDGVLVDLYCGVGGHGLALAQGRRVIGVDMSLEAIAAARQAAERHGIDGRFEVLRDDDADVAAELDALLGGQELAAIVVNPARAGLHPSLMPWLASKRDAIDALLYLSCEPQTLTRDLIRLQRAGFVIEKAQPIDMMPNTDQVETLVKLVRGSDTSEGEGATPIEHAFGAARGGAPRRLSPRVSGVCFSKGGRSRWWAAVSGKAPKHGELPSIEGSAARLVSRRVDQTRAYSILEIEAEGLCEDAEIRQRLRAWGYPVMGDTDFGDRRVNRRAYRIMGLDRAALHCLEDEEQGVALLASELILCFGA